MNYTIADYTIESLGRGMSSISCKVKGYWSRDTITLYVQRGFYGTADWKISMSYGSGGRDTKEVASDTEACRYFAEALVAMCNLADDLMLRKDRLEDAYQAYAAEIKAENDRINAEKQAKIDADPALGTVKAKEIVGEMLAKQFCVANAFKRGADRPVKIELSTRAKAVFYINGVRTSRTDVVNYLAECSVRSAIVGTV